MVRVAYRPHPVRRAEKRIARTDEPSRACGNFVLLIGPFVSPDTFDSLPPGQPELAMRPKHVLHRIETYGRGWASP